MGKKFRSAWFRPWALLIVLISFNLSLDLSARAAEGIREIDLEITGLVYDPFTQKLYGAATNNLLQIDPESGQVLRAFDLGSSITRMALGAGHGIWVGASNSVRRFNLETLAPEDPVTINGLVIDVAPSPSDPYTVAVSTPRITFRWEAVTLVRNGAVLPDTAVQTMFAAINGSFIFVGNALRMGIGPNGIVIPGYQTITVHHAGRMQSLDDYVYHSSGAFWNAITLNQPEKATLQEPWGAPSTLAVHPAGNAVYFLSDNYFYWDLNRHEHRTFKQTGHFRFPRFATEGNMVDRSLAAWSSNRVAFHSEAKLYLVDTDKLFLPADVAITQTVTRSPIEFGTNLFVTITVTNHGPGAALNVTLTNSISTGQISNDHFFTLQPGDSVDALVEIRPAKLGVVTSQGSVRASNDPNPENNSAQVAATVLRPADPVTEMSFPAIDLAYDPSLRRLFFSSGGGIHSYDPEGVEIFSPGPSAIPQPGFPKIVAAPGGGSIFTARQYGALQRIDSATFAITPIAAIGQTAFDIAISPASSNLYAISDERGTYLLTSAGQLGEIIPQQGNAEFSADGTKLYFVDSGACALSIYRVGEEGLTLESATNNVSCSGFRVANGLLYFDSGLIYDPDTLQKTANSMSFSPPSFVIPRSNGLLDLLNRTNGVWTLRRINEQTREPAMTVQLPSLVGSPVQMVEAGADRVAIRTSSGPFGFYVAEYDSPDEFRAQITIGANDRITLSFGSVAGASYRMETTASFTNPVWRTVRDNIAGTGARIEEVLPPASFSAFYRIVRI